MEFTRYAIYYMPPEGAFAAFGARWLGWDALRGRPVPQPALPGIAALTGTPRKYGFHGTLKPPFRLAPGTTADGLSRAVQALAADTAPALAPGLQLSRLGRFFALTIDGEETGVARIAAACVTGLDGFRARPSEAELARRRKSQLSPRQEALLQAWGYPHVLDAFRFHLTLTERVERAALDAVEEQIRAHLPDLPAPFRVDDIVLAGERPDGRFQLVERFTLTG
ncbi:MAG: DUF1045 domain-containing protein [Rhodobacteraceae bacterium]|nr:DUF1045 domain-containing protein [Paracoccaceae bacterium]